MNRKVRTNIFFAICVISLLVIIGIVGFHIGVNSTAYEDFHSDGFDSNYYKSRFHIQALSDF